MRERLTGLVAAVVVVSLELVGCGGDGGVPQMQRPRLLL